MSRGIHTETKLTVHIVFVTKYRYKVLKGEIQKRCRELIRQTCEANDIKILKGVISGEHVHLHIEYPAKLSVSEISRKIKGRSAHKLLREYPELRRKYYGGHLWGIGYGAWSTGNITKTMIDKYLEHHRSGEINKDEDFILE